MAAIGEGKYMKLPIEKIADFDKDENEWQVVNSNDDPETISI